MKVLDPAGVAAVMARALAARPRALRGLTIGILDNSKPNAGALLSHVASLLVDRGGAARVQTWRKPGASQPATPGLLDEIAATAGLLLTGSAD